MNDSLDTLRNTADEELALQSQAGSLPAFQEIVRRFQVPLLRFVRRRTSCLADAEDIVQDALVLGWRKLDQYSPKYALRTWLFTITYRTWVGSGRRAKLKLVESDTITQMNATPPDAEMERAEERGNLWKLAREVLSVDQYSALWLFYVEEMPASEIGKVMGRSWVSVKTMLHRARKRLGVALSEGQEFHSSPDAVKRREQTASR